MFVFHSTLSVDKLDWRLKLQNGALFYQDFLVAVVLRRQKSAMQEIYTIGFFLNFNNRNRIEPNCIERVHSISTLVRI